MNQKTETTVGIIILLIITAALMMIGGLILDGLGFFDTFAVGELCDTSLEKEAEYGAFDDCR